MSALYVGAYALSYSYEASSSSAGEATNVSGVSVSVSDASCSNCSAYAALGFEALGALSYGGSISFYVGAHGYSYSNGAADRLSRSFCNLTRVLGLDISVQSSDFQLSRASSRTSSCSCFHFMTVSSRLVFQEQLVEPRMRMCIVFGSFCVLCT